MSLQHCCQSACQTLSDVHCICVMQCMQTLNELRATAFVIVGSSGTHSSCAAAAAAAACTKTSIWWCWVTFFHSFFLYSKRCMRGWAGFKNGNNKSTLSSYLFPSWYHRIRTTIQCSSSTSCVKCHTKWEEILQFEDCSLKWKSFLGRRRAKSNNFVEQKCLQGSHYSLFDSEEQQYAQLFLFNG